MTTIIRGRDHELGMLLKKTVLRALKTELCEVRFIKADGTKRSMLCSLHPTFLPEQEGPSSWEAIQKRNDNPYWVPVWDVEAEAWRSFTLERFNLLTVIGE